MILLGNIMWHSVQDITMRYKRWCGMKMKGNEMEATSHLLLRLKINKSDSDVYFNKLNF